MRGRASAGRWTVGLGTGVYLAAAMGALAVLLVRGDAEGGFATNLAYLTAWVALYAASLWAWWRARAPLTVASVALLAFAGWATLSAIWSPQPMTTAAYGAALAANVAFVAWTRARLSLDGFLRVALVATTVLAALGIVLYLAGFEAAAYVDAHGRSTWVGTQPLRGLFNHKITAGTYAVLAAVMAWYVAPVRLRVPWIAFLVIFVVLTGSTAAIVLLALATLAIAFLWLAARVRWSPATVVAAVAVVVAMGVVSLPTVVTPTLAALGRDASLTGRTDLWAWGWTVAADRPLQGWGFFGYAGSTQARADKAELSRFANYDPPHFHNAYLQSWIDLGVIGALFGPLVLVASLRAVARRGLGTGDRASLATAALLIVITGAGLGMHAFFQYNHFLTLMLMRAFAEVRFR